MRVCSVLTDQEKKDMEARMVERANAGLDAKGGTGIVRATLSIVTG